MKSVTLIIIVISIVELLSTGCIKDDNGCKYNDFDYIDSTLYISFKADGVQRKYYQMYPSRLDGYTGYAVYTGTNSTVARYNYASPFLGVFEKSQLLEMGLPDVSLQIFYAKQVAGTDDNSILNVDLTKVFTPTLFVTDSEANYDNNNIRTFIGYSLFIYKNGFSTDNVFKYYNYFSHPELIEPFFQNTNFRISSFRQMCNNFYMIEGTFNTKLGLKSGTILNTMELTDGKFRMLKKIE
jgi:hypothetical protein